MKRLLALLLLISALTPAPAAAGPIYPRDLDPDDLAWFYNRPGATPEQVTADASECARFGARLIDPPGDSGAPVARGIVPEIMLAIAIAGPIVAYTDDCMMSKGYRRFNVRDPTLRQFNARLSAMSPEMQAEFAGAETPPEGAIARLWVNTYWRPVDGEAVVISTAERAHRSVSPRFMTREAKLFIDALEEGAPLSPGLNDAVLVMTLRSLGRDEGKVYLARDHFSSGEPDPVRVGRRDRWPTARAEAGGRRVDSSGAVRLVFVVPAGTYALSAVGQGYYIRSSFFCYGTLAFTARAGDVVHLGAYTVETEPPAVHPLAPAPRQRLRVDLPTLEAARGDLVQSPELAARMGLAEYINNFPHSCPETVGIAAYGLDMPGAPSWHPEANASSP